MKEFCLVFIFFALVSCKGENENPEEVTLEVSTDKISEETTIKDPEAPVIAPGEYIEYHPNGGIKMKGVYDKDLLRQGLWMSFYETGIKWSESYYSEGKLDGHSLTFYPNGQIRYVGEYQNDKKTGTWSFYDESGNLTKEEKY